MAKYNRGINTKQNKASKDRIANYEWNDLWNEVTEFGEYIEAGLQSLNESALTFEEHTTETTNPHEVTAEQTGAAEEIHTHTESDITDLDKYDTATVDSRFLRVEGQNGMEADLTMGGYKITNLAEPTQDDDGTTKKYVDAELATKSNIGHVHTESDITDLDKYSQSEANALLDTKLDVDVYNTFMENFDLDGDT